ncbi:MAG: serine/threonine protein kinase [Phycisphaerales bacterium]|nr:serine/threonine protein kinase [Phycisphaerales bacterium]
MTRVSTPAADDGTWPPETNDDLEQLRASLPAYDITDRLQHGGQGVVYKAIQRSTNRPVAIKVLLFGPFATPTQRRRFVREVELASRLRHRNIVSIFDSGTAAGRQYVVMEFVEGMSIDDHVDWLACSPKDSVVLFAKVVRAVHAAHTAGIVHRDLKPSNILVDSDGEPRILDFGLARELSPISDEATDSTTTAQQAVGTLAYLSPELLSGNGGGDVLSDVYALGIVFYRILTGCFPFSVHGTSEQIRERILQDEPQLVSRTLAHGEGHPTQHRPHAVRDLDAIVNKALSKDTVYRYQSAASFADDLDRYLRGDVVVARATNRRYVLLRTVWRYRIAATVAAVILVGLGAVAATVVSLMVQRDVASATGSVRLEQERISAFGMLDMLESQEPYAQLFGQFIADDLRGSSWQAEAGRIGNAIEVHDGGLCSFVADCPMTVEMAIRNRAGPIPPNIAEWLSRNQSNLDGLAVELERASLRFPVSCDSTFALDTEYGAVHQAVQLCSVFLLQAYACSDLENHALSIQNARAAERLAADIDRGISDRHKALAQRCYAQILGFARHVLVRAAQTEQGTGYIEWIKGIREIPGCGTASHHMVIKVLQVANGSLVYDRRTTSPRLDLDLMNQLSGGFLSNVGAMTPRQRAAAESMTPEAVATLVRDFVETARQWDRLNLVELVEAVDACDKRLRTMRESNPVSLLLPFSGNGYVERLVLRAQRRALRLAAECLPNTGVQSATACSESRGRIVDPITGGPFDVEMGGDDLVVRSQPVSPSTWELVRRVASTGATIELDNGRITYFKQ